MNQRHRWVAGKWSINRVVCVVQIQHTFFKVYDHNKIPFHKNRIQHWSMMIFSHIIRMQFLCTYFLSVDIIISIWVDAIRRSSGFFGFPSQIKQEQVGKFTLQCLNFCCCSFWTTNFYNFRISIKLIIELIDSFLSFFSC